MSEFVLYNYYRSSASYRARIALNLKGLPFEYKAVHLLNNGGEQFSKEYESLNPSREVPTLVHNGKTIAQSMAILEYLDGIKSEPRLFPQDPYSRALVVQACEIVNSGIQPIMNLRVLNELKKSFSATQEQTNQWISRWIIYGLESLEAFLKPHAGKFCFGDQLTAADCFLVPQLAGADRFKVDLSPFPTLLRIRRHCEELEAFKKASPKLQPDTPPEA